MCRVFGYSFVERRSLDVEKLAEGMEANRRVEFCGWRVGVRVWGFGIWDL